ncbi:MAG: flagellar basal body rod protein FlgC [SAR324 cluster bacterium]|uniref:Flagellar basal-body rod protein FlgC n=1 Tax=SAR324 cluster bacterium TaxID=2024889 RepID=A0A7X9IKF7_9DELT|nr:flagellar basal body rod protein FlgC [SAR324 cluster bacterium]
MFNVIEVLASGLSAARTRVNVLASNIANAETTRTPEGGPFKRRDVRQVALTQQSAFESELDRMSLAKPFIDRVVEDQSDPKRVYEPGHPDADKDGYVSYPNINVVTSMTDLMSASRLYQANITAVQVVREMADAAKNISVA